MQLNPNANSVTYKISELGDIETSLDELERIVLSDNSINSPDARSIAYELKLIRQILSLRKGVDKHNKFSQDINDLGICSHCRNHHQPHCKTSQA